MYYRCRQAMRDRVSSRYTWIGYSQRAEVGLRCICYDLDCTQSPCTVRSPLIGCLSSVVSAWFIQQCTDKEPSLYLALFVYPLFIHY